MRFSRRCRIAGLVPVTLLCCATCLRGESWVGSDEATHVATRETWLSGESAPPDSNEWETASETSHDPAAWGEPDDNGNWLFAESPRSVPRLAELSPECESDPAQTLGIFVGYDAWRGYPDGNWQNNGIHTGVNVGTRLGRLSDWLGVGAQAGGSVGVYNWSGTDYRKYHQGAGQVQGFITYGLFRRANETSRISASLVQDWMLNSNYSVYAQDPTMAQWRAQAGYALTSADELGFWGAWRLKSGTEWIDDERTVTWRPINQISVYWHHKWGVGDPDTWIWVGLPEHDRLKGEGSLGDYYIGLLANCPFNDAVSLYALATYMHPSASPGPLGAKEDQWNFSIGLTIYPQKIARTKTVAGRCWVPGMPVANNGTFLVDASRTY